MQRTLGSIVMLSAVMHTKCFRMQKHARCPTNYGCIQLRHACSHAYYTFPHAAACFPVLLDGKWGMHALQVVLLTYAWLLAPTALPNHCQVNRKKPHGLQARLSWMQENPLASHADRKSPSCALCMRAHCSLAYGSRTQTLVIRTTTTFLKANQKPIKAN